MTPLLIALQFLTRLPVKVTDHNEHSVRDSLYWYGVAGAAIGMVLLLIQTLLLWLLPWDADAVVSALLLVCWVLITGALHIDGLADTADAWLGGGGDREKTLRIMKDPQSGPAGVSAVALMLLLKFSLVLYLQQHQQWAYLVLVPLASRSMIPLLFLTTPYVRNNGLASAFSSGIQPEKIVPGLVLALLAGMLLGGGGWLLALALTAGIFWLARRLMLQRIGGTTGDTAGALIEVLEAALLAGCLWTL